jgi:hypothetical protein
MSINAPRGSGPTLRKHPYEEVQVGARTSTTGAGVIEAGAGQVVVGSGKRFFEGGVIRRHWSLSTRRISAPESCTSPTARLHLKSLEDRGTS